jgi:serine/threonine protein kinase
VFLDPLSFSLQDSYEGQINLSGNPNAALRIAHLKTTSKLHQSLFHPSIVSLISVFSSSEAQFHVLEYCSNETLFHCVKMSPTGRLSEPELRGAAKMLLDGLAYLRKKLIIHRDLKPDNVLVSGDWRLVCP